MNLFQRQIFSTSSTLYNTYIGGVSSTINTPALLAVKLDIDVVRIKNFAIDGANIKCRILGFYDITDSSGTFSTGFGVNADITYFYDKENLQRILYNYTFWNCPNLKKLELFGLTSIKEFSFGTSPIYDLNFPNVISLFGIPNVPSKISLYIPLCTIIGDTVSNDSVFLNIVSGSIIYCHPSLATNNAGAPDGDLTYAISQGAIVRYVTSFVAPNSINDLTIGAIYATALQLNFTAPTESTNAIEYYECYANGVLKNTITGSGQYINGLSPNTTYDIDLKPVDVFYNKSTSNIISQNTIATYYTDADANAYISAASLTSSEQESAYRLIVDLKSNLLWSKIQAIYPFKGTTVAQHKWNAKNPLDTNSAFRLIFSGAATFSNLGYKLNGSSYANTHFIPSINQNINSNGMTIVCGTNIENLGDNWAIAAYDSGTQNSILKIIGDGAINLNGTRILGSSSLGQIGIFTATKQSATLSKLFKNNVEKITGNSGGTLPTNPFYIGAIANIDYGYIKERIQMAIIHEGLSDTEVTTLHAIIDLSETIAGRKTW